MANRRVIAMAVSSIWAVAAAAVSLSALRSVNADARTLVTAVSVLGVLMGAFAVVQLHRHSDRSAGVLLVLSALVTPTYFAYVLNLIPLLAGIVVLWSAFRRPVHTIGRCENPSADALDIGKAGSRPVGGRFGDRDAGLYDRAAMTPSPDSPDEPAEGAIIGTAEVAKVAKLARLRLTDDELGRFTHQLADILEHARDIEGLQLDDVEPMARPLPLVNVFRADVVGEPLDRDEVLAAAPMVEDHRFRVPPSLGEEQ